MSPTAFSRLPSFSRKTAAALCAAAAAFVSLPTRAVVFTELGDAGQTQATAQATFGTPGRLTDIFGSLLSATDADLYVVDITSPASFSASTFNATGGSLDTELFLLTLAGAPVALNDDEGSGNSVLSTLPSGSRFAALTAGRYLLGVSLSGYDPVNGNNQLLFANGLSTSVRGAANGLQPAVLGGFFDSTFYADSGAYDIQLTGVGTAVAAIPEPSTNALLLLGVLVGGVALARRPRTATAASTA